ncbi:hypothetical protein G6F56_013067 [Rhizopus delemar]|nr:hypothetical protein G6F56_013067 [Rhizopus delemar]
MCWNGCASPPPAGRCATSARSVPTAGDPASRPWPGDGRAAGLPGRRRRTGTGTVPAAWRRHADARAAATAARRSAPPAIAGGCAAGPAPCRVRHRRRPASAGRCPAPGVSDAYGRGSVLPRRCRTGGGGRAADGRRTGASAADRCAGTGAG